MKKKNFDIPDIEQYLEDGRLVEPYDKELKIDYQGFIAYVKEKYNGDSTNMTQEEKDRFILSKPTEKRNVA